MPTLNSIYTHKTMCVYIYICMYACIVVYKDIMGLYLPTYLLPTCPTTYLPTQHTHTQLPIVRTDVHLCMRAQVSGLLVSF